MQLEHFLYKDGYWDKTLNSAMDSENTLVILFSSFDIDAVRKPFQEIIEAYPHSLIMGASTAGTIYMDTIEEESCSVTVAKFTQTKLKLVTTSVKTMADSFEAGKHLGAALQDESLKHIFTLSNGLHTNGSELVGGLDASFKTQIPVSGALAGDNGSFEATWVITGKKIDPHGITALGFYGDKFRMSASFKDGLDIFGIQRLVTKSKANVLYELDGKPALEIYKKYLGPQAENLPLSALSFPLSIETDEEHNITRTILAVNFDDNSMTFAGDIPEGSYVSFMKANLDRVITGANQAAKELDFTEHNDEQILSIAISCIGRKAILKQRAEEELEAVLEQMPKNTLQIGMYSFGEISPAGNKCCELHNQTMTLTAIWEQDA